MENLFTLIKNWSEITFPDAVSADHLRKLSQEVNEAINDPFDLTEYADCLIALSSAVNRAGFTFDQWVNATQQKLKVNEQRKWLKNNDGTHQHI